MPGMPDHLLIFSRADREGIVGRKHVFVKVRSGSRISKVCGLIRIVQPQDPALSRSAQCAQRRELDVFYLDQIRMIAKQGLLKGIGQSLVAVRLHPVAEMPLDLSTPSGLCTSTTACSPSKCPKLRASCSEASSVSSMMSNSHRRRRNSPSIRRAPPWRGGNTQNGATSSNRGRPVRVPRPKLKDDVSSDAWLPDTASMGGLTRTTLRRARERCAEPAPQLLNPQARAATRKAGRIPAAAATRRHCG